jgi:hypothetical protein
VKLARITGVAVVAALVTAGIAAASMNAPRAAAPTAAAVTRSVAPAVAAPAPRAIAPAAAAALAAAPAKEAPKHTLDTAVGMTVLDTCGLALLPLALSAVGLGLAGGSLPPEVRNGMATVTQVVGIPAGTACTALPVPKSQTVCPNDVVANMPGLVPPPQGRAIDLIDGAETTAAASGAPNPGIAPMARSQLNCKDTPF